MIGLATVVVIAGAVIGAKVLQSRALFDSSTAVHINADDIDSKTLIIGTHLIALEGYTQEIYDIATESATDSGQTSIYYKSEIGGDAWYDITSASSLSNINGECTAVDSSVINALYFTHQTDADGITTDLRTGETVSVFDINDPYDLMNLEEVESFKAQYDLLEKTVESDEATDSDRILTEYVAYSFLTQSLEDDLTNTCDEELDTLQTYYERLKSMDDMDTEAKIVSNVMSSIDSQRRYETMRLLLEEEFNMEYYLNCFECSIYHFAIPQAELLKAYNNKNSDVDNLADFEDVNVSDVITVNQNYLETFSTAYSNVQSSESTYENEMLSEGTTISSQMNYSLVMELIDEVKSGDNDSADYTLQEIMYLQNIDDGIIGNQSGEKSFLEETLIPEALSQYKASVSAGVNDKYQAQASNANVTDKALKTILKAEKSDTNSIRGELQTFLDAWKLRSTTSEIKTTFQSYYNDCTTIEASVIEDAYEPYAKETIADYRSYLQSVIDDAVTEAGDSEGDLLQAQKEAYQEAKQQCLDNNDLAGAKKYDTLISAVDTKLDAADNSPTNQLAKELAEQVRTDAKNGDYEDASSGLEALSALASQNPNAVNRVMTSLVNDLTNTALQQSSGNSSTTTTDSDSTDSDSTSSDTDTDDTDNTDSSDTDSSDDSSSDSTDDDSSDSSSSDSDKNGDDSSTDTDTDSSDTDSSDTDSTDTDSSDDSSSDNSGTDSSSDTDTDTDNDTDQTTSDNSESSGTDSSTNSGTTSTTTVSTGIASLDDLLNAAVELQAEAEQASGSTNTVTSNDMTNAVLDALSVASEEELLALSEEKAASAVAAVAKYAEENNNETAEKLAAKLGKKLANADNDYVYSDLNGTSSSSDDLYISARALAKALNYVYVYNVGEKKVTLTSKGHYHTFSAYKDTVDNDGESEDEMSAITGFSGTVYIPVSYCEQEFGIDAYKLGNSGYNIITTKEMQDLIDTITDSLGSL